MKNPAGMLPKPLGAKMSSCVSNASAPTPTCVGLRVLEHAVSCRRAWSSDFRVSESSQFISEEENSCSGV